MKKRTIFKSVLAIIAIANFVLLFGFEYEIFGFKWMNFYNRNNTSSASGATIQPISAATNQASEASTESSTTPDKGNNEDSTLGKTEELIAATTETAAVEDSYKKCRVISGKNARIRSGPGTEYERITSVPNGTILTVISVEDNGWVHIVTDDGIEGYVSGDLVEMLED